MAGLCLTQTIQSSSGQAAQTAFSFSTLDFDSLNYVINERRDTDRSAQPAKVTGLSLRYPGGKVVDAGSYNGFTIPED